MTIYIPFPGPAARCMLFSMHFLDVPLLITMRRTMFSTVPPKVGIASKKLD